MKDPKRIRIGGKYYEVVKDTRPIHELENAGLMELEKCKITYAKDQDPQQQRDTVLHECIHAIDETMGIGLSEEQVLRLGAGMYALMVENPLFVKWIMSGRRE